MIGNNRLFCSDNKDYKSRKSTEILLSLLTEVEVLLMFIKSDKFKDEIFEAFGFEQSNIEILNDEKLTHIEEIIEEINNKAKKK
jgi:hypothetical protein